MLFRSVMDLPLELQEKTEGEIKEEDMIQYTDKDYTASNAAQNRYLNITFTNDNDK